MALIDSEGFGLSTTYADFVSYGVLTTDLVGAGTFSINTGGALGDPYMRISTANNTQSSIVGRTLSQTVSAFQFGYRCRLQIPASSSTFQAALYFTDILNVEQFHLIFDNAGGITVMRGASVLGSIAAVLNVGGGMWQYLEVAAVVATGTSGSVSLYLNGNPAAILTISGVNTQNSTLPGVRRVRFYATPLNGNIGVSFHDVMHIYLTDTTGAAPNNTIIGDVRVASLAPVSNATVGFTPVGLANNWQNAAKNPPLPGTDYNTAVTVGVSDLFNCGSLAAGLSTVFGVNVRALMLKTDAGFRGGAVEIASSGTIATGASNVLNLSGQMIGGVFAIDPATGLAFTNAGVNALQSGYIVSA